MVCQCLLAGCGISPTLAPTCTPSPRCLLLTQQHLLLSQQPAGSLSQVLLRVYVGVWGGGG